jgi:hypothetical protein
MKQEQRAWIATLLRLILLDSDAAAAVDVSIRRRATVRSFAEDRLGAERASGLGVAASHHDQHRAAPFEGANDVAASVR